MHSMLPYSPRGIPLGLLIIGWLSSIDLRGTDDNQPIMSRPRGNIECVNWIKTFELPRCPLDIVLICFTYSSLFTLFTFKTISNGHLEIEVQTYVHTVFIQLTLTMRLPHDDMTLHNITLIISIANNLACWHSISPILVIILVIAWSCQIFFPINNSFAILNMLLVWFTEKTSINFLVLITYLRLMGKNIWQMLQSYPLRDF